MSEIPGEIRGLMTEAGEYDVATEAEAYLAEWPAEDYAQRLAAHRNEHGGFDPRCDECRWLSEVARHLFEAKRAGEQPIMSAFLHPADLTGDPELPTIGEFATEKALFYKGQLNGIHGRGGTMKSWIVLYVALQQAKLGNTALLFDYEIGRKRITRRLGTLGATARLGRAAGVLAPHMPTPGAPVPADRHQQGGRSPAQRLVRQLPRDGVPGSSCTPAASAPALGAVIGLQDPARQDRKEPTGYESPLMWLWFRNSLKLKTAATAT